MNLIPGINDLPKLQLHSADGASAEIYLHGAHLTSWKTSDGVERLFLSPLSEFKTGAAIRGGVPVIFPQFSALGPLPKHGFARNHAWELVESSGGTAKLRFVGNAETAASWPHSFVCEMLFGIGGNALEMKLSVANTGTQAFGFHASLHGYFAVESLAAARVTGLGGLSWRENPTATVHQQSAEEIAFSAEVDRTFYSAAERSVELHTGSDILRFNQHGFCDSVVWNPGAEVGARIADLEPSSYLRYVCVEAASIQPPVHLPAGAEWTGTQRVECRPG
jgi:glucose-6-phosphate 1-epimerase